jgi:hypothetical protein
VTAAPIPGKPAARSPKDKDDQMNKDDPKNSNSGPGPGDGRPWRAAGLAAALAVTALLAAACGGGSHAPGSRSDQNTAAQVDAYASCMRSHGVADFYFTHQTGTSTPPPDGAMLDFHGYTADVNPTLAFEAAQKVCNHLLGLPSTPPHESHQQFLKQLKSAKCMRSHGYPNWPDPNPTIHVVGIPAGVDTNSPQYQAAAKACGEPAGPPGK